MKLDIRGGRLRPLAWILLAALAGIGCADAPHAPPAASAATTTDGAAETPYAPEFELSDLGGRSVSLADYAGQVRLIDFWATWCPPCRDEIPMLNELHRDYADRGLTILAISDERADVVREFADKFAMDYTNLLDPQSEVTEKYRVIGLPTAFLLDREGRVVETFFGPKPRKALESQIRELLELPPST